MLYLYDPCTNISKKTTYKEVEGMSGHTLSNLSHGKSKGRKITRINCYLTDGMAPLKQRREWYAKEYYSDESWLPLLDAKNKYHISNYGRVKKFYAHSERLMLPYQRKGIGNLWVKIDGKERVIGHLVADVYLRKRSPNERVVRKNGIVTDDYVSNLEIITTHELGNRTGYMAKNKPVMKIDAKTKEVLSEYKSAREAARNYPLSYQAILDRCNRVHSQSDGLIWVFEDEYIGVEMIV